MKHRDFLVKTMTVVLTLFIAACKAQSTSEPVLIPTETLTPIPPTEAPTLTPTPEPTSTPTIAPTPIGGKSGLLLNQFVCPENGDCVQTIFLYNLVSHELNSFLDGYAAVDVSPDGKNILLKKNAWEAGDLFLLDLAKPEQITLFQRDVDDAVWLGDSGWIGFITKVNGKRQVFLVHPDGSDLTQVTNSSMEAVALEPVFNDGVFWGEGTIAGDGSSYLDSYKWTKLDGTETRFTNVKSVFPNGKYLITRSMSGMGPELLDVTTSKTRELSLSKPSSALEFGPGVLPLSDDKWLVENFASTPDTDPRFFIYSPDGNMLAELPSEYWVVDSTDPPSPYDLLSPDGNWILVNQEEMTEEQFEVTYHLFNTMTAEIKDLPNLCYPSTGFKWIGNRWFGCQISHYFWVEIP